MHPTAPWFIAVLYVCVYYGAARSAMRRLRVIDPECYARLGGKPGVGMSNSMAVGRMLFDSGLPKPAYPRSVKLRIALARGMLLFGAPAALGLILLAKLVG